MEQQVIPADSILKIITSHSLDNVFDYCPRKFEFLTLYSKRPKRESGYAANVGTALHDGMQAWLISRAEGNDEMTRTRDAYMAFLRAFPFADELEQTTKVRSFDNCVLMLYNMIRAPEWDDWELMWVDGKGWAVEVPFRVDHVSVGPVYIKDRNQYAILSSQGKIDMLMRHRATGQVKSVDIKTTVLGVDMIRSNYEFSGQQTGYSQVAHAMAGVNPDSFSVDYAVCIFTADGPQLKFVSIDKDSQDIDDYWLTKIDRLERIKRYAEQGWFPRTNGGCNSWGKECSMFDICHSRDTKMIQRWYDFEIETEETKGYDYWVELEI